jgi:hypothetical protein
MANEHEARKGLRSAAGSDILIWETGLYENIGSSVIMLCVDTAS